MKYRKKPVIIEAFRFQIDDVMPDWFNEKRITNDIITHEDGTCDIKTLEGTMKANFGDYVIKGVQGEVYPCKPDIFDKTYEKVELENEEKWSSTSNLNYITSLRTGKILNYSKSDEIYPYPIKSTDIYTSYLDNFLIISSLLKVLIQFVLFHASLSPNN